MQSLYESRASALLGLMTAVARCLFCVLCNVHRVRTCQCSKRDCLTAVDRAGVHAADDDRRKIRRYMDFSCPRHFCQSCREHTVGKKILSCWRCLNAFHSSCRPMTARMLTSKHFECADCSSTLREYAKLGLQNVAEQLRQPGEQNSDAPARKEQLLVEEELRRWAADPPADAEAILPWTEGKFLYHPFHADLDTESQWCALTSLYARTCTARNLSLMVTSANMLAFLLREQRRRTAVKVWRCQRVIPWHRCACRLARIAQCLRRLQGRQFIDLSPCTPTGLKPAPRTMKRLTSGSGGEPKLRVTASPSPAGRKGRKQVDRDMSPLVADVVAGSLGGEVAGVAAASNRARRARNNVSIVEWESSSSSQSASSA